MARGRLQGVALWTLVVVGVLTRCTHADDPTQCVLGDDGSCENVDGPTLQPTGFRGDFLLNTLVQCERDLACVPHFAIRVDGAAGVEFDLPGHVDEFIQDVVHDNFASTLKPASQPFPLFNHCLLAKDDHVFRSRDERVADFVKQVFLMVEALPHHNVTLSRFDLWHGHLFRNQGVVGILFHALEFPMYHPDTFPYYLGYCQIGSNLEFDRQAMALRNVLWIANTNSLWMLDARDAIVLDVVQDFARETYTVFEGDLGQVVSDVYFLEEHGVSWSPYPPFEPLVEDGNVGKVPT